MQLLTQLRQCHFAKTRQKQRLGIAECLVHHRIYCLFNQASGGFASIADPKQCWGSQGEVNVVQCHSVYIAGKPPTTTVPFFGLDKALFSEASQNSPNNNRIGMHHLGHCV